MNAGPAWRSPARVRFRRLLGSGLVAAALVLLNGTSLHFAAAQGGSSGGSVIPPANIGVKNKSISGGPPATTVAPAAEPKTGKHRKPRRHADTEEEQSAKPAGKRCPDIAGTWNSWASGLFGKGDTTFSADGSATHRSSIPGKWWCKSGKLFIQWGGESAKQFTLSDDRKRIVGSSGLVGFRR